MAGLSDNAIEVLEARYLIRDKDGEVCETPDEMWERIARAISKVEKKHKQKQYREEFLSILKPPIKFLPNSPTLMNAGHPDGGVLAGCFVILIEDTMAQLLEPSKFGILDAVYTAAIVQKYGGGTGFSLSRLRPAGAAVGMARKSACGPLGVLHMLNATSELIKQGGRRAGANIGVLRCDAPDIIEFINCKRQEGVLTNFNLSVGITDHFLNALASGSKYDLVDPKTKKRTGQLLAKDVFDNIVRNIHRNGEPGVVFLDTINSGHPARNLGPIEATNPCITGDSLMTTPGGLRRIDQIVESGGSFKLWNGHRFVYATAFSTGEKETYEITLTNGMKVRATADHQFPIVPDTKTAVDCNYSNMTCYTTTELIECLDAGEKNLIVPFPKKPGPVKPEVHRLLVFKGFMQGDGSYHEASGRWKYVNLGRNDGDVLRWITKRFGALDEPSPSKPHMYGLPSHMLDVCYSLIPAPIPFRPLSEVIMRLEPRKIPSFLKGVYSANGSVLKVGRVTLKSTCKRFIEQVQLLLSMIGIESYITTNKPTAVEFENGTYTCKESYDLNITRPPNLRRFRNLVGFIQRYKQERLREVCKRKEGRRLPVKIKSIKYVGVEDVYDFNMSEGHHFGVANGILVHNCAEQPLLPFESCVLGSLNLVNHMNSEGHLDFMKLGKTIDIAVRFLDNTIDCSPYPIKEIESATKDTRKIGLGVMGWADILISNNMLYGSKKAVSFARKLSAFLKNRATEASEKLAKEKGPFPAYEKTKRVIRTPRRNACLTTIAPTGSISKIADCSPGIEPTFGAVYSTTILDGQTLEFIHPEFQRMVNPDRKMLDAIREKEGSLKGIKGIPANLADLFAKGTEIDTKWHVKMQAAFQESIDSGVSKTVNLPNDATQKDVSEIILLAAEEGCKGITAYRHGSRDLQVITYKGETVLRPKPVFPAPRPDKLQGATNRYCVGECGKLYITTNLHEKTGLPIEIFGQASGACPALIGIANKLMSLILRMGADAEWLAGKLDVLPCHACRDRRATVRSCPDAFRKDLLNAIDKPAIALLGTHLPQVAPMVCGACNKGILERMPTLKGRDCRVCTFCGKDVC